MAKTDDSTYTHPDTGETVQIPEGAVVNRNEDGEITDWTGTPEYTGEDLHPDHVEGYEPHFERTGTTRRVLAFVTDQEHLGRPRNTVEVIAEDMGSDPFSAIDGSLDVVQKHLDQLAEAGLAEQRDDGTWAVTEAGLTELEN
jgi:DNA-binding transcriptional ArsR family regulator